MRAYVAPTAVDEGSTKQRPNAVILNCDMKISASHRDIGVPRRIPHLGERSPACERMTDERVPPVVNRQDF